jgi:hypothetical protein
MSKAEEFTMGYFYDELRKRVSANNAKLLLHTAAVKTGMSPRMETTLKKEDAQAICMELIRSGGPGFQVGRAIYTQLA